MANCLAVGLLLATLRPRSRRFLAGFVACGAITSTFFIAATMWAEVFVNFYLIPPMALYEATMGPPPRLRGGRRKRTECWSVS